MRNALLASLCLIGVIVSSPAAAQSPRAFSVAARVGTLGPGLEVTAGLSPRFNLRLAGHYLSYGRTDRIDDYDFEFESDATLKLGSATLFADYFPARRGFRLTGGFVLNRNHADVLLTPLESHFINRKEYTPAQIGTVRAKLGHKSSLNPYLGIGVGNSVREGAKLGFVFDLGVLYTGSPSVELEGTGMITPTAEQAPEIEENLQNYRLYPLLSIGLSYRI